MARSNKKLIIVASILTIFLSIYFFIDRYLLPIKLRHLIIQKIEETTQRKIELQGIHFHLTKGIVLQGVSIFEKDPAMGTFIKLDELSFSLIIPALLKNKTIIIPHVRLASPEITVLRHENNLWNFSDFLSRPQTPGNRQPPPAMLLKKLTLDSGTIHFRDKTIPNGFNETLRDIDLNILLSLNKTIDFELTAQIPSTSSSLKIQGDYNLTSHKLKALADMDNIALAKYLVYNPSKRHKFYDGFLSTHQLEIQYQKQKAQAKGDLILRGGHFSIDDNKEYAGNLNITNALFVWENHALAGRAHAQATNLNIKLPYAQTILGEDIQAAIESIAIGNQKISIQGNLFWKSGFYSIGTEKKLRGNLEGRNIAFSRDGTTVKLKGGFGITNTSFELGGPKSFLGEISVDSFVFNKQNDSDIDLSGRVTSVSTDYHWGADEFLKGDLDVAINKLSWRTPQLTINGRANLTNGYVKWLEDKILKGNITATETTIDYTNQKFNISAQGNLKEAFLQWGNQWTIEDDDAALSLRYTNAPNENPSRSWLGEAQLAHAKLSGIPKFETLHNIRGGLTFTPNKLSTEQLTLTTQETALTLAGALSNFEQPFLNIQGLSDSVELSKLLALFPEFQSQIPFNIQGLSALKLKYRGHLNNPDQADIDLETTLRNVTVSGRKLPFPVTQISGNVSYHPNQLTWKDLHGIYQGRSYTIDGGLDNFKNPEIKTSLEAKDLSIKTHLKQLENAYQILLLQGNAYNSSVDLKGFIHLDDQKTPLIHINGNLTLDSKDLPSFSPQFAKNMATLKPKGLLSISGEFKGRADQWKDWKISLKGHSENFSLLDYPLNNFKLRYAQDDQTIKDLTLSSTVFDGLVNLQATADLNEPANPADITASIDHLNLAQLRDYKKIKNEYLDGLLNIVFNLKGPLANWRGWSGEGSLNISEGYIFRWKILEGIGGALLIPEFRDVVFTDASADLIILDQKVQSENVKLKSPAITLSGKGYIDFDKNINFDIVPTFSEITILKSESLKKWTTNLLRQAINIKLTGTLDQPTHKVETGPIKMLEKTTTVIKEGVGGIIDNILQ